MRTRGKRAAFVFVMTFASALGAAPSFAAAEDAEVVGRVQQFGRMAQRDARDTVRAVDAALRDNAARGGESYDRLRRAVNVALFGPTAGPGRTRDVYNQRLSEVLAQMQRGIDGRVLEAMFPSGQSRALECATDLGLTMGQCDALAAAASRQPIALPYIRPDTGAALTKALRRGRVRGRLSQEIPRKLRAVMIGAPRNITEDARGRAIAELLEACPGALTNREAQLRAWHLGPTEPMAQCFVRALLARATEQEAIEKAKTVFELSDRAARAFVAWGAPAQPQPVAQTTTPPPNDQRNAATTTTTPDASPGAAARWREAARQHFAAQRYPQAAAGYEAAIAIDGNDAAAWAGLGASRLAMRDAAAAAHAYEQAVQRDGRNSGYFTMLARALVQMGDRGRAISALRRALEIDPNNQSAQRGLASLGAGAPAQQAQQAQQTQQTQQQQTPPGGPVQQTPPGPTLPEVPPRDAIIATLRPLQAGVEACAPAFNGVVSFQIVVLGETGTVSSATATGDIAGTPEAGCMENIVRAATFPRFAREELEIAYPFRL